MAHSLIVNRLNRWECFTSNIKERRKGTNGWLKQNHLIASLQVRFDILTGDIELWLDQNPVSGVGAGTSKISSRANEWSSCSRLNSVVYWQSMVHLGLIYLLF